MLHSREVQPGTEGVPLLPPLMPKELKEVTMKNAHQRENTIKREKLFLFLKNQMEILELRTITKM